jgi:hypothetical protein
VSQLRRYVGRIYPDWLPLANRFSERGEARLSALLEHMNPQFPKHRLRIQSCVMFIPAPGAHPQRITQSFWLLGAASKAVESLDTWALLQHQQTQAIDRLVMVQACTKPNQPVQPPFTMWESQVVDAFRPVTSLKGHAQKLGVDLCEPQESVSNARQRFNRMI